MARTITIELPDDIDADDYADLAHATWMLLKIAHRADDSTVWVDTADQADTQTARWRSYEAEKPWQVK